jgi:hypothetical protein
MAWVLQHSGAQLSEAVMTVAASKGHTDLCQYLYGQQCPWNKYSTRCAAHFGHVDLLRWLIANGCDWNASDVCLAAAQGGQIAVLVYMQQQSLLSSAARLTRTLACAGCHNKLAAAQWLRAQGAEWPAVFKRQWSSEVLAWARAEGCDTPANEE